MKKYRNKFLFFYYLGFIIFLLAYFFVDTFWLCSVLLVYYSFLAGPMLILSVYMTELCRYFFVYFLFYLLFRLFPSMYSKKSTFLGIYTNIKGLKQYWIVIKVYWNNYNYFFVIVYNFIFLIFMFYLYTINKIAVIIVILSFNLVMCIAIRFKKYLLTIPGFYTQTKNTILNMALAFVMSVYAYICIELGDEFFNKNLNKVTLIFELVKQRPFTKLFYHQTWYCEHANFWTYLLFLSKESLYKNYFYLLNQFFIKNQTTSSLNNLKSLMKENLETNKLQSSKDSILLKELNNRDNFETLQLDNFKNYSNTEFNLYDNYHVSQTLIKDTNTKNLTEIQTLKDTQKLTAHSMRSLERCKFVDFIPRNFISVESWVQLDPLLSLYRKSLLKDVLLKADMTYKSYQESLEYLQYEEAFQKQNLLFKEDITKWVDNNIIKMPKNKLQYNILNYALFNVQKEEFTDFYKQPTTNLYNFNAYYKGFNLFDDLEHFGYKHLWNLDLFLHLHIKYDWLFDFLNPSRGANLVKALPSEDKFIYNYNFILASIKKQQIYELIKEELMQKTYKFMHLKTKLEKKAWFKAFKDHSEYVIKESLSKLAFNAVIQKDSLILKYAESSVKVMYQLDDVNYKFYMKPKVDKLVDNFNTVTKDLDTTKIPNLLERLVYFLLDYSEECIEKTIETIGKIAYHHNFKEILRINGLNNKALFNIEKYIDYLEQIDREKRLIRMYNLIALEAYNVDYKHPIVDDASFFTYLNIQERASQNNIDWTWMVIFKTILTHPYDESNLFYTHYTYHLWGDWFDLFIDRGEITAWLMQEWIGKGFFDEFFEVEEIEEFLCEVFDLDLISVFAEKSYIVEEQKSLLLLYYLYIAEMLLEQQFKELDTLIDAAEIISEEDLRQRTVYGLYLYAERFSLVESFKDVSKTLAFSEKYKPDWFTKKYLLSDWSTHSIKAYKQEQLLFDWYKQPKNKL